MKHIFAAVLLTIGGREVRLVLFPHRWHRALKKDPQPGEVIQYLRN